MAAATSKSSPISEKLPVSSNSPDKNITPLMAVTMDTATGTENFSPKKTIISRLVHTGKEKNSVVAMPPGM